MTTKLSLYNDALLACGERFLASLSENSEARYLLDQVYASGAIKYCLERGQWSFATRTVQVDYDSDIEPGFGYSRAFTQPTDYCATKALCADEFFNVPLLRYVHEGTYFYADLDAIYLRYVSSDPLYGMNLNAWPETFREAVAYHLASRIIKKLGQSEEQKALMEKERDKLLKEAKSADAQREASTFPAPGSWVSARRRSIGGDRGNSGGSLIG